MTVLVIGGTGTVGSRVVGALVKEGVDVRVLTRQPDKARLPDGARAVEGDLMKPDSLRAAMQGINTLFLLNAVAPDELNSGPDRPRPRPFIQVEGNRLFLGLPSRNLHRRSPFHRKARC